MIKRGTFITLLLVGYLLIVIGEPFEYLSFMSAGTALIFLCTIALFLFRLFEYKSMVELSDILLFLFLIFSAFSFVCSGRYTYANFVPLMCFIEIPILISSFNDQEESVEKKIYVVYYILSLWYIILSFTNVAYLYRGEYGDVFIQELTLGFSNPNQTAIYLCFTLFVLFSAIYKTSNKKFRVLCIINSIVILWFIIKTQSRAGIVVAIFFVFVLIVRKQSTINKWFRNKFLLIPLLFALFLLLFGNTYADLMFMNEEFDTGRNAIFQSAIDSMHDITNIFFGNYITYAHQNLHNSIVSVFVEYGVFVLILFALLFHTKVKSVYKNIKTELDAVPFFAMLMIFIYSSVEAAFFISGSFYAVSFFSLFYLCLPRKDIGNEVLVNESTSD